MTPAPTIRESAKARLLLYKLIRSKLSQTQKRILSAKPELWEQVIKSLELESDTKKNTKTISAALITIFAAIDLQAFKGLSNQIKILNGPGSLIRIKPTALLDTFIKEHLTLIKSVEREQLEKIGLSIQRGIREGLLQKDIEASIRQSTDTCKRRARLIARAAPLQYSGALTRHHQTNAGIKKYRWQTSRDERVRSSHESREGEVYNWGGAGPHPRSEVNCRCDAVPVL